MKFLPSSLLIILISTAPAFAISIGSPSNGEHVSSPFTLSASSGYCSSHPIRTIGYSLDNGGTILFRGKTSIDTRVSASKGTHTIHVKAWNTQGRVCLADVAFDVTYATDNVVANTSVVPSNATSVSSIQRLGGWHASHDGATGGWARGSMSLVGSPVHSGSSRKFVTTFSGRAGERYSATFGDNRTSTNFFYDAWVYFTDSASKIANLELDLNQTMPNGQTVFMGVQCDGYTGTWDYSENYGTAYHPRGIWGHSRAACNPRSWSRYKWHHIQASYSRTSTGRVTYKAVYLDGVEHPLNVTVFAARASGWGSSIMTQFQIDSTGSGTVTAYLDDLTIKRW